MKRNFMLSTAGLGELAYQLYNHTIPPSKVEWADSTLSMASYGTEVGDNVSSKVGIGNSPLGLCGCSFKLLLLLCTGRFIGCRGCRERLGLDWNEVRWLAVMLDCMRRWDCGAGRAGLANTWPGTCIPLWPVYLT